LRELHVATGNRLTKKGKKKKGKPDTTPSEGVRKKIENEKRGTVLLCPGRKKEKHNYQIIAGCTPRRKTQDRQVQLKVRLEGERWKSVEKERRVGEVIRS